VGLWVPLLEKGCCWPVEGDDESVAPALPCVGCWLTGENGAAAAGGENRMREM